jgi:Acetyltransferase (GNAT) domain
MQFLRIDSIHQWADGEYSVTTDKTRVDHEVVHRYLSQESYWAKGRAREQMDQLIAASRCYSLRHDPSDANVGFARVVTDGYSIGWIGDVFVLDAHRGGRGKFLMSCIRDDLAPVRRVMLGTQDAHGLYAQFGFAPLGRPELWMERILDHDPAR